jgi:hypothetical protein
VEPLELLVDNFKQIATAQKGHLLALFRKNKEERGGVQLR